MHVSPIRNRHQQDGPPHERGGYRYRTPFHVCSFFMLRYGGEASLDFTAQQCRSRARALVGHCAAPAVCGI